MVIDLAEMDSLEQHLLVCAECLQRAEDIADYVDAIRAAIIIGKHDLEC
jgi:hypothetical protein